MSFIVICLLILLAIIVACNVWWLRTALGTGAPVRPGPMVKHSVWKSSALMLGLMAVLGAIGVLWLAVAAVISQSETLHENGVGLFALGAVLINPGLLLLIAFTRSDA
ncbi:hypothetical protein [Burkholderia cenocepacia]|uniref:hypothetical protein n=1 Tax=Burkholderia cenocepacia TaxID=95486 RepID=UPI001B90968F|nr:hypothetical protein [Burkholderia cenocepacia]MBR7945420.1 hypothetical protein [Burkholderia cenocepacia]